MTNIPKSTNSDYAPKTESGSLKRIFIFGGPLLAVITHLAIWKNRFYFDDEWFNLKLIANLSFPNLLNFLSKNDIHPPLSYIINQAVYRLIGPHEFLMTLPSLLFTGLTAALIGLLVHRISGNKTASLFALIFSVIHPNFQLFGWSIRWYPLWNLLIIAAICLTLDIWNRRSNHTVVKSVILTITLSAALYTNYLTFFLVSTIALLSALKFIFTRKHPSSVPAKNFIFTLSAAIIGLLTIIPWITSLIRHLANFFAHNQFLQTTYFKTLSSLFYGLYSTFTSVIGASIYPWNTSFILIAAISLAGLIICAVILMLRNRNTAGPDHRLGKSVNPADPASILRNRLFLDSLLIAGILLLLLTGNAVFTHSHKARGLLPLSSFAVALTAVLLADLIAVINHHGWKSLNFWRLSQAFLIFFLAGSWLIGTGNIIAGKHLHKMAFADPVPEIIKIIHQEIETSENPVILITSHPALTFYSLWENLNGKLTVISPLTDSAPRFIRPENAQNRSLVIPPAPYEVILIDSYLGSYLPRRNVVDDVFELIKSNGEPLAPSMKLYPDSDYNYKRKLFPKSDLRPWRFIIDTYLVSDTLDITILHDFTKL